MVLFIELIVARFLILVVIFTYCLQRTHNERENIALFISNLSFIVNLQMHQNLFLIMKFKN